MEQVLQVKHGYATREEHALIVGLSDGEWSYPRHVILTLATGHDQQDEALGTRGVHLEWGDQSRSGYGLVSSVTWMDDAVSIATTPEAQELGIPGTIILHDAAAQLDADDRAVLDGIIAAL